jgi:hypothetical protein
MSINMKDGARGRRGYAAGMVDFFAIYIIPTDDWYIIPYGVVGDRDANVFFKPGMKGQKYEKYREAWHLLVDACQPPAKGPIDIQASCDEEAETRVAKEERDGEGGCSKDVPRSVPELVRKSPLLAKDARNEAPHMDLSELRTENLSHKQVAMLIRPIKLLIPLIRNSGSVY